jgi:hypothetical protein
VIVFEKLSFSKHTTVIKGTMIQFWHQRMPTHAQHSSTVPAPGVTIEQTCRERIDKNPAEKKTTNYWTLRTKPPWPSDLSMRMSLTLNNSVLSMSPCLFSSTKLRARMPSKVLGLGPTLRQGDGHAPVNMMRHSRHTTAGYTLSCRLVKRG